MSAYDIINETEINFTCKILDISG
uniref:Uncharacterized protein n=1 Tax=Arundo donax TaxID=35708 RepID=A0A0A9HS32_ARUDO